MIDNQQLLRHALLIGWAILFGYFFGQLLWFVLPFAWPINVIFGYLGGIIAGASFAYYVIDKIKPFVARVVVMLIILIFVGIVSKVLNQLSGQQAITRMEIQELRDNATRPQ